jgi:hypothetical protein
MTTLQQTVVIPADRRLVFPLPETITPGTATVVLTITSIEEATQKTAQKAVDTRSDFQRHFDELYGRFKNRDLWDGDGTEYIRRIRDEW